MAKYLTSAGLSKALAKIDQVITAVKTELTTKITTDVGTVTTALETKVDVEAGKELIATTEVAKLAKLAVSDDGLLSIDNIPPAAIPTCVTVETVEAMYELDETQVQAGDTVRVAPVDGSTPLMYYVVDTANLGNENGYRVYAAVSDWSAVTNVPAKVVQPSALKIQVNGTDVQTYTGLEDNEVVANITMTELNIEDITDEEIDAMFADWDNKVTEATDDPVA